MYVIYATHVFDSTIINPNDTTEELFETGNRDVLQQVQLYSQTTEDCRLKYDVSSNNITIDDNLHICVGGHYKDTCKV